MDIEKKDISQMTDEEFEKFSDSPAPFQPGEEEKEAEEQVEAETENQEEEGDEAAKIEPEEKEEEEKEEIEPEEEEKKPSLPYSKFKKQKEKWEAEKTKYEEEISGIRSKLGELETIASSKNIEKDVDKFIEDNDMDKNTVMGLINIVKKHAGLSPEDRARIEKFEKNQEQTSEKLAFENDFADNVLPLINETNPKATAEQIKKAKDKFKEIVYDDKNLNVPTEYLVSHFRSELLKYTEAPKGKATLEKTRPGSQYGRRELDPENITREDINNMTDEEFEKYSNEMAAKTGNGLIIKRKGQVVNN